MSSPGESDGYRHALSELEAAVEAAVARIEAMEEELREVRGRASKLEELLERFRDGDARPEEMAQRLETLEEENRTLVGRLERGRASVERLLSRIRFLEERG